jgi:hypothetical protein
METRMIDTETREACAAIAMSYAEECLQLAFDGLATDPGFAKLRTARDTETAWLEVSNLTLATSHGYATAARIATDIAKAIRGMTS